LEDKMDSNFRIPHDHRGQLRGKDPALRTTEPELQAIPESRITAEQMGIRGGQGRSGEEVRGSGRVMKWLVIALMIIFISWLVAMPFLSK
jgi:hypothetical protein